MVVTIISHNAMYKKRNLWKKSQSFKNNMQKSLHRKTELNSSPYNLIDNWSYRHFKQIFNKFFQIFNLITEIQLIPD